MLLLLRLPLSRAFACFLLLSLIPCCTHPQPSRSSAANPCSDRSLCLAYVERVRDRVIEHWQTNPEVAGGQVRLRFGLDRAGRLFMIDMMGADSGPLADSCFEAFHRAEPFDPPPAELAGRIFLVTFEFSGSQRAAAPAAQGGL